MKTFLKGIGWILLLGILAATTGLLIWGIEDSPQVARPEKPSFDQVKRIKKLVEKSKPARMRKRQINRLVVHEADLNLLVNYSATKVLDANAFFSRIELLESRMTTYATVVLPSTFLGNYINLRWGLKSDGPRLEVVDVRLGAIPIPKWIVDPTVGLLHRFLLHIDFYRNLMEGVEHIRQIAIDPTMLTIVYEWNPGTIAKLKESGKTLLLQKEHQKRLLYYTNAMTEVLADRKKRKVSLVSVIGPLFLLAEQQSKKSNDPVGENRALLQALSLYTTGNSLQSYIHADLHKRIKPRSRCSITLLGRKDLVKHLIVSAGLTVSAGSRMANLLGIAKEVGDSDGGSGFSFADLAADKAGVKLGQLAVGSVREAEKLQKKVGAIAREKDLMPSIDHLPEGMMELAFKKRYTDLDSKTYALINDEIERRIRRCRVFQ